MWAGENALGKRIGTTLQVQLGRIRQIITLIVSYVPTIRALDVRATLGEFRLLRQEVIRHFFDFN